MTRPHDEQVPVRDFRSDNVSGAHPTIVEAIVRHSSGKATPYGKSDVDRRLEERLAEVFEHNDMQVFFCATGTASNSLGLASVTVSKPGSIVFSHRESHVIVQECNAPAYFGGGTQFVTVDGDQGKMDIADLRDKVESASKLDVHRGRPVAITITQATEAGTVYSLDELSEISSIAKEHDLAVHMDGSRFANAVAALGCTPAEMSWKAGVDMLSFGATKNGCWCAEVLIYFDKYRAEDFIFLRKRAGQLFSKTRFVSAQLEAYLHDGLWLQLANHANQMASLLASIFQDSVSARLAWTPQTNAVFVVMKKLALDRLEIAGVLFMRWPRLKGVHVGKDEEVGRFVASFSTERWEVEGIARLLCES